MNRHDGWFSGAAYEPYVGRWSRLVAREFLAWLAIPAGRRWLDVGCGTGALSEAILLFGQPSQVKGIDPSESYLSFAHQQINDSRFTSKIGNAQALPCESAGYDAAVSGLMLNFVPVPQEAVAEMTRVASPGATVAAYVWDYAGQMQLMRHFWDAAAALDPEAARLDEGRRFSFCQPEPLEGLFKNAGLINVESRSIDVPTNFRDFEDYWTPFLGGQGSAPGYAMSLTEDHRESLRQQVYDGLPIAADGSISLIARAWAVRGRRPGI